MINFSTFDSYYSLAIEFHPAIVTSTEGEGFAI